MEGPSTPAQAGSRPTVKRIAIDARFYHTGTGVARYLKNFLRQLPAADPQTNYTIIVQPQSVAELRALCPRHWTIVGLGIGHYSLGEQTALLRYLNRQQFDLVYFTMFNHPMLYRGKFVVMIHDLIMHFYPPRSLWHPRTWAYRLVMWHAAHAAKAIITNSEMTKRDVVKYLHVPPSKCHAILLAVEDTFGPASGAEIKRVKAKYDIKKPYVLFLNAWRPHKGLPELVGAWEKRQRDDLQLVIGGQPNPAFPEIIAAVESAQAPDKSILTLGFIDDNDLPTLYSGAKVYINPSHYEGFGFGLLEAMACGAPVLAGDNACLKEVGSEAAHYFHTQSADDLARQLECLLDDNSLRADLVQKGFRRVQNFSFARLTTQTLGVFNSVLKQS